MFVNVLVLMRCDAVRGVVLCFTMCTCCLPLPGLEYSLRPCAVGYAAEVDDHAEVSLLDDVDVLDDVSGRCVPCDSCDDQASHDDVS